MTDESTNTQSITTTDVSTTVSTSPVPNLTIIRDPKNPDASLIRWKARQRMAWYSLVGIFIYSLLLLFALPYFYLIMEIPTSQWQTTISSASDWVYISLGSVILGYMGTTAWMVKGKNIKVDEKDY